MDTRAETDGLPSAIGPRQLLKTPERVVGTIKSRDGDTGAISKSRSAKKVGNAG